MNGRDLVEIVYIERWKPGSGANGERKQREEKDAEEKTRSARREEDEEGDGRSNDVCATMNGRDLVEIDFIERWKPGSGANEERKQKETRTRRRSCTCHAVTRESEGNGQSNGVCAAMNGCDLCAPNANGLLWRAIKRRKKASRCEKAPEQR